MQVVRLRIEGLRGIESADIRLGEHSVLVGPNNSGKTTIVEALALLFGRDRLVRRLTEHDFHGSDPDATSRIVIVATISGFAGNSPEQHPAWFGMDRGVEKWIDPQTGVLHAERDDEAWQLAVQIGLAARFDLDRLEPETVRFFVYDEGHLGDPFADDSHLSVVSTRLLQELGFFLVPATRSWDRWISFTSELFRRVIAARGGVPAGAIRTERQRLWKPPEGQELEKQPGLSSIVSAVNEELRHLMSALPQLQLRLTATDSDSVLEAVVPHFAEGAGPTLPTSRHGSGLVSLQSLLLLLQFGRARAEKNLPFVLAVEEPELHIQPSQQKRLVNRLNALCDQTIVTTHSPTVAAMFGPEQTVFIETRDGVLTARPLVDVVPAAPTNLQQHLFFGWRQRVVGALMHEYVLVPEGPSDGAWLEALQTALETRQEWLVDAEDPTRFGTFVGVVPTHEAKVAETLDVVQRVHRFGAVLLDSDEAGRGYLNSLKARAVPPYCVITWPAGWVLEHVIAWIAEGEWDAALAAIDQAIGRRFETADELLAFLLTQKSYAPVIEGVAVALMGSAACRERAIAVLGGIADVLRGIPPGASFVKDEQASTERLGVYVFVS